MGKPNQSGIIPEKQAVSEERQPLAKRLAGFPGTLWQLNGQCDRRSVSWRPLFKPFTPEKLIAYAAPLLTGELFGESFLQNPPSVAKQVERIEEFRQAPF